MPKFSNHCTGIRLPLVYVRDNVMIPRTLPFSKQKIMYPSTSHHIRNCARIERI